MNSEQIERMVSPLERRIAALEKAQVSVPLRQGIGGLGTARPEWVAVLPPIPTTPKGYRKVFWMSVANDPAGTGDDQAWEVFTGQAAYTPCQYASSLSGVPV